MSRNHSLGVKICALIDWKAAYADFKIQQCTYREYREGAFVDFLKFYNITEYVPSLSTISLHFKELRDQEEAESSAKEENIQPEEAKSERETSEKSSQEQEGVDVFVLDDIKDALSHESDLLSVAQDELAHAPLSSSSTPIPTTNHARNMGSLTTLEATWHGAVFKIPCINPEESLARLLVKLKVFEEKSNAHQL